MAVAPPRQLLELAQRQGRDTHIPPVAVQVSLLPGYDPHDDKTLLEPSLLLTPCVHPLLEAFLDTTGATRLGRMSWMQALSEDRYDPAPLRMLLHRLMPGTLFAESDVATPRSRKDLKSVRALTKSQGVRELLRGTRAAVTDAALDQVVKHDYPTAGPGQYGAVTLSRSPALLIKVVTNDLKVPEHLPQIPLNLRPAGRQMADPKPVRPAEAVAVLDWLVSEGIQLVDRSDDNTLAVIRDRVARSLIATPTPGRPASAEVSVGRMLFRHAETTKLPLPAPAGPEASSRGRLSAVEVASLAQKLPEGAAVVHPGTADVGRMALATPVVDDRLRDYQREAVGLHDVTELGFLNCVSPGLGKTVMTYCGMQRRTGTRPRYRGLVVAEANVRAQWRTEAADWFPQAQVVTIESRRDAHRLAQALDAPGPVVAVISYGLLATVTTELAARTLADPETDGNYGVEGQTATVDDTVVPFPVPAAEGAPDPADAAQPEDLLMLLAQMQAADAREAAAQAADAAAEVGGDDPQSEPTVTLGQLLLDTRWHDIVADEAEVLRGTGSKQGAAMWELRRRSDVGIVLTGTPINRGVDDLGRLISWARNDQHLFYGVKLSDQFDLDDDEQLAEFLHSMGPVLFRRDTSEIADELPTIVPTVMKLRPSTEEKALAHAARAELKRVYEELLAWVDMVQAADPDNPAYTQAKEQLKEARGAWLGGTQLARMASSDPAALLDSRSAGAALLAGQGLIEAANQVPGTKRTAIITEVARRVAAGHRVLIFTEFATVAKGLLADLEDAAVAAGGVLGGGGRKRDANIAAFQAGNLDVLVCTQSGEKGLNLQQATTVVHYDLPWTPKGIIQRTGRARRIKSQNQTLEVLFPLMEGTIEERVAALVVSRAVEAMRALDASRGVDTSQTEMGLALGGLVDALADTPEGDGLMAMTQALVA